MKYAADYATTAVPDALKTQIVTALYWERLRQWQLRFRNWLRDARTPEPAEFEETPLMDKYRLLFQVLRRDCRQGREVL